MFKLNSFNKEFSYNKNFLFLEMLPILEKRSLEVRYFIITCKFTTLRKVSRKAKERYISAHL